jgi:hypothetical protein
VPVRDKVLQMEAEWRGLLAQVTREAIASGELRADLDAEQFVFELCGIHLVHHVSTRFVRDPSSNARARTAFDALVARARAQH